MMIPIDISPGGLNHQPDQFNAYFEVDFLRETAPLLELKEPTWLADCRHDNQKVAVSTEDDLALDTNEKLNCINPEISQGIHI